MTKTRNSLPIRSVAVASVVLRLDETPAKVLLLRRRKGVLAGQWCQVTGSIEDGETARQAAAREIREETGLVPDAFYSADFCDQFYNVDENCIELIPIFVAILKNDQKVRINRENSEYRWVTIERAIEMVPFVGHRTVLHHVERDFVERAPAAWRRITMDGGP